MFNHLLKLAWRNIRRHSAYSLVNILGLSIGICACISIYVITHFEFSFDRFHRDGDRIYRVMGVVTETTGDKARFTVVPPEVLALAQGKLTGVEAIAGVMARDVLFKGVPVDQAVETVPAYFDVFDYRWLAGDPHSALSRPATVVLTQSSAQKYFGRLSPEKYLGKDVVYDDSLHYEVTGVIRDWDGNTDLGFTDFLAGRFDSTGWQRPDMTARLFVKLAKGIRPAAVESQLGQLVREHADRQARLALSLSPLSAMHFDSAIMENPTRTAHLPTLYGLIAMAIAILALAVINFVNLATAYNLQRVREVGLRKVLGSSRARLVIFFLTETGLLILLSMGISLLLVNPVLRAFHDYLPAGVTFHPGSVGTIAFLLGLFVVTGLLAGLYPARVATASKPVALLRGGGDGKDGEKWWLRRGLIVVQFAVALVFIAGSLVIREQLRYVRNKDLGFRSDAIVNLSIPAGQSFEQLKKLQTLVLSVPGVADVARQWLSPLTGNPRQMKIKFASSDVKDFWVMQVAGDEHYIPLYGIRILAGRNLFPADSVREFVINESLARRMGCKRPGEALGKMLYWNDRPYPIVGVVADFHTRSLHDPITPLCIVNRADREFNLAVKLGVRGQGTGAIQPILARIEQIWKSVYPSGVWDWTFYDETLNRLYDNDRRTEALVNVAVGLTLLISCIGMFGLTLWTVRKRAREISIRKVLGARVIQLLLLLCREWIVLIGVALSIATPVALVLLHRWLDGFAYHVQIGWYTFAAAGLGTVGLALLTVSGQVLRAAIANPVKNLRVE